MYVSVFLAAFKVIMLPGCCPRGLLHLINLSGETGLCCAAALTPSGTEQGTKSSPLSSSAAPNITSHCVPLDPHAQQLADHLTQKGNS